MLAAESGLDVAVSLLDELGDLDPDDLGTAIVAAETALLIEAAGGRVRFRHGPTRDAVLGAVPASQRQQVADRALETLGDTTVLDDLHRGPRRRWRLTMANPRVPLDFAWRSASGHRGAACSRPRSGWLRLARDSAADDDDLRAEETASLVESLSHSG